MPAWLAVLFLAMLTVGTDEFVIAGVLPEIADDLGVSAAAAGQLVTVFAVVYAIGAQTLALVTDRLPRRALIVASLLVFAAANAGAALAPGYWSLMAARIVAALAAATVAAASFATAASAAPEGRQGRYLGVVTAGLTVALLTGVPVGTWLAGALGWRTTFWLLTVLGALVAAGVLASAPRIAAGEPSSFAERFAPLRDRSILRLLAVTFVAASGGLMFYTYVGPFTTQVAGGSFQLRALALLIVGIAGVGAVLLAGRATDARGPAPTLKLVLGGHAAALLLLAALAFSGQDSPVLLLAAIAIWSVFAWGLNPPVQGSLLTAAPQAGMTALALNISALYLGTGIAGALGGTVTALADTRYIPLAGGLLLLGSLALTPRTRRHTATCPDQPCAGVTATPAIDGRPSA